MRSFTKIRILNSRKMTTRKTIATIKPDFSKASGWLKSWSTPGGACAAGPESNFSLSSGVMVLVVVLSETLHNSLYKRHVHKGIGDMYD
jgi:hypothetical protein